MPRRQRGRGLLALSAPAQKGDLAEWCELVGGAGQHAGLQVPDPQEEGAVSKGKTTYDLTHAEPCFSDAHSSALTSREPWPPSETVARDLWSHPGSAIGLGLTTRRSPANPPATKMGRQSPQLLSPPPDLSP